MQDDNAVMLREVGGLRTVELKEQATSDELRSIERETQ